MSEKPFESNELGEMVVEQVPDIEHLRVIRHQLEMACRRLKAMETGEEAHTRRRWSEVTAILTAVIARLPEIR